MRDYVLAEEMVFNQVFTGETVSSQMFNLLYMHV